MPSAGPPDAAMRRVMVLGCAGAGKTTFSRRLAAVLKLPLIHLDRHFWRPHWQLPDPQDWRKMVAELAVGSEWVMDGNYSSTYDLRMPRADTVIWLDFPRMICMRRVLTRMVKGYGRSRPDLPEQCPERFDFTFLRYVWDFPDKHRPRIANAIERLGGHLRVIQLGNDREAGHFLSMLRSA